MGSQKRVQPLDSRLFVIAVIIMTLTLWEESWQWGESEGRMFCHDLFYWDEGRDNRKVSPAHSPNVLNNLNVRGGKMAW